MIYLIHILIIVLLAEILILEVCSEYKKLNRNILFNDFRAVQDHQRSLAMGLQNCLGKLIGTIQTMLYFFYVQLKRFTL